MVVKPGQEPAVDAAAPEWWLNVYDDTVDQIYRYLYHRLGGDRQGAEDALQEVYLQAFRKRGRYDHRRGDPVHWLMGFAATEVASRRRKRGIEQRGIDAMKQTLRNLDSAPLPDEMLVRRDLQDTVGAALASIPERYRAILQRKYCEGMSVAKISAASGDSPKAVESLLTRARDAFEHSLARRE